MWITSFLVLPLLPLMLLMFLFQLFTGQIDLVQMFDLPGLWQAILEVLQDFLPWLF